MRTALQAADELQLPKAVEEKESSANCTHTERGQPN